MNKKLGFFLWKIQGDKDQTSFWQSSFQITPYLLMFKILVVLSILEWSEQLPYEHFQNTPKAPKYFTENSRLACLAELAELCILFRSTKCCKNTSSLLWDITIAPFVVNLPWDTEFSKENCITMAHIMPSVLKTLQWFLQRRVLKKNGTTCPKVLFFT